MYLYYIRLSALLLLLSTNVYAALAPKSTASRYGFHTEEDVLGTAKTMAATCGFMVGVAEQTAAFKYFLSLASRPEIASSFIWIFGNWIVAAGLSFWRKETSEQRISKLYDSDKKDSAAKIVADYMYRQKRISVHQIPETEKAYIQARNGIAVPNIAYLRAYHNILMRKAVLSTFFWRGCAAAMLGGPLSGIVGCYISHQAGIMHAPLRL